MNKLALALAFSAIGATAGSAQIINLNTGASIVTDRIQDGTWRQEGNTDIYVRTRVDANGNRIVERARRDALGNYTIIDSRVLTRDGNRGRADNTWKRSGDQNNVFVRTRIDANGNRIVERARRDANGNYVIIDSRVVSSNGGRDRSDDGIDDRRDNGRSNDGKWKKDKNGKKWDKAMRKGEGKHGKNHENDDNNDNNNDDNNDDGN